MYSAIKKSAGFTEQFYARPDQIFLVRGRDSMSKHAWYYVAIDRDKRDVFRNSHCASSMTLSDYGNVLYSGYGSEPPKAVKELMHAQYGFLENA